MSREVTVVTPENIPLTLELAGLGSRFGALLIDILLQVLASLILLVVGALVVAVTGASLPALGEALSGWLIAAGVLVLFFLWFGYFILFEAVWNGQTPGKKLFGLRVVRDGGYPVNIFAVVARNLVRIADFLPGNYGIGALSVFFHAQYKRLGDLAAGTLVVKERPPGGIAVEEAVSTNLGTSAAPSLPPTMRHPAEVLRPEELALLRRFAVRRWQMTSDDSERLAYRLVAPLVARLNLTFAPGAAPRYADLVSVLVAAADAREEDAFR